MSTNSNFKHIIKTLEDFATSHSMINSFGWGDISNVSTKDVVYPQLFLQPIPSASEGNMLTLKFDMLLLDVVKQDNSNQLDVMNQMLMIGNDVISNFWDNEEGFQFIVEQGSVSISPFSARFDDNLGGWIFEITVQIQNDLGECGIPLEYQLGNYAIATTNIYNHQTTYFDVDTFNNHTGNTSIHFVKSDVLLDELGNVNVSGATNGYVLSYSGGSWIGIPLSQDNNNYTTGATLVGNAIIFDRNDIQSAYSVNLNEITGLNNYLPLSGGVLTGAVTGTSINAATILSGGTDLYNIFLTTADGNDITRIQAGTNITTGGTANNPIINVVASPSFNSITASGATSLQTLSAVTILSGGTDLYNIFSTPAQNVSLYLPLSGGTINGNLTVTGVTNLKELTATTALFSSNISATTLAAATERIITTTSGSSQLYNYLQTDSQWITDTTLQTALLLETNWVLDVYTGTTIGAVEGSWWKGNSYLYLYQNSEFKRINFTKIFGTVTDNTHFEDDGTLVCNGSATTFEDIIISASNLRSGLTPPSFVNFIGGIYVYSFANATTDILYGSFELPHSYKEGSDIEVHVHWLPSTTNVGNVKFQFEYGIANMNTEAYTATTIVTGVTATSGIANQHQYTSVVTISNANLKIGAIIPFAISRLGSDAADTFTGNCYVLSIGVHYEQDTLGSRVRTSK